MTLVSYREIKVKMTAVCKRCHLRHKIECSPDRVSAEVVDWEHKHPAGRGCVTAYDCHSRRIPRNLNDRLYSKRGVEPWFLAYGENTNFNFAYRASAAITNAIAALASSATLVAGWESAIIDNSTNKDLDILVSALVTCGTTPTANTVIEIHSVSMRDDSTWPDVFDGTTSAETITSVGVKDNICQPLAFLNVNAATSNVGYEMSKQSLAARYGGICPDKSVLFTTQNTGAALNATSGNFSFAQQSMYVVGA